MNTITKNLQNTALVALFAVAALIALSPVAYAADFDGGFDYIDTYSAPYDYGYDYVDTYSAPYDYSYDYIDTYTPYDTGYDYVDTYTPDYMYGSSGYSSPSYFTGSGYLTSSYLSGPSYIASRPSAPSYSNTNVNTCLNNSCNTNVSAPTTINAPTTVVTNNPAPVYPVYNYPTCNTCGCSGYAPCYNYPPVYQNPPVIAYNQTPYIALSAVPYTGLELGFWGTIAYWGFLVLWCLVAAYLIVVKKIQNRVLRSLNSFLFGNDATAETPSLALKGANSGVSASAQYAPVVQVDAIDPFIISQINRVRA